MRYEKPATGDRQHRPRVNRRETEDRPFAALTRDARATSEITEQADSHCLEERPLVIVARDAYTVIQIAGLLSLNSPALVQREPFFSGPCVSRLQAQIAP